MHYFPSASVEETQWGMVVWLAHKSLFAAIASLFLLPPFLSGYIVNGPAWLPGCLLCFTHMHHPRELVAFDASLSSHNASDDDDDDADDSDG